MALTNDEHMHANNSDDNNIHQYREVWNCLTLIAPYKLGKMSTSQCYRCNAFANGSEFKRSYYL